MQGHATVTIIRIDNGLDLFHVLKHKLQKWINVPAVVDKEVEAGEKSYGKGKLCYSQSIVTRPVDGVKKGRPKYQKCRWKTDSQAPIV